MRVGLVVGMAASNWRTARREHAYVEDESGQAARLSPRQSQIALKENV